jgi:hypothetical protein
MKPTYNGVETDLNTAKRRLSEQQSSEPQTGGGGGCKGKFKII